MPGMWYTLSLFFSGGFCSNLAQSYIVQQLSRLHTFQHLAALEAG